MTITALLTTAAIFFPFWMTIWQERPIQNDDLNYETPTYMTVETYEMLLNCLPTVDARLRDQIYTQLASKPVPANQEVLLHCLRTEPETRQQGTILRLLRHTELAAIPPGAIAAFLELEQPTQLTEAAIQLYGSLPEASPERLRPFLGQPAGNTLPNILRRRAWEAFAATPRLADALGADVLPFREADDITFQALALQAALSQTSRRPQINDWLDAALSGDILLRLAVARDPHPTRTEVMRRVLDDDSPAVRIAFCLANRGTALAILLVALDDQDDAIRHEAVRALARFPRLDPAAIRRLTDCLSDPSMPVREEAEATLLLHAAQEHREDVLLELTARLTDESTSTLRYHLCRLFASLNHVGGEPAVAALLADEQAPETIAAALDALVTLSKPDTHGELILRHARHPSALVRQAVANALGRLNISGSEKTIQALSLDRDSPAVRATAFAAMGYFPRPVFAGDLLACLKNTGKTTEEERTHAAWAVGKIKPTTPDETAAMVAIAKRLVEQVSLPVVPGDMEPSFDGLAVIANAIYSITVMGKTIDSPEIKERADIILNIYDLPAEQLENLAMSRVNQPSAQDIPRSPTTCSLANQARQWQKNAQITTQAVPTGSIYFPVRPAR